MSTPLSITPRLGCAERYDAQIRVLNRNMAPLARQIVTHLSGLLSIEFDRSVGDYSEAVVRLRPLAGDDCCAKLVTQWDGAGNVADPGVWPWSHELYLFRDSEPVWWGPITYVTERIDPAEQTEYFQIHARDLSSWLDNRVIQNHTPFATPVDLSVIGKWVVEDAMSVDDVGLDVAALTTVDAAGVEQPNPQRMSGRLGTRTTRRWEAYAGDELRELTRAGLVWTCIGSDIITSGNTPTPGVGMPELRNRDFQAGVELDLVGSAACSVGYAVGGGGSAETEPPKVRRIMAGTVDGTSPFFGRIERLANGGQATDPVYLTSLADQLLDGAMPPPRRVTIPSGATLSPEANVSIHELIPGRFFKLNIRGTCSQTLAAMQLTHVSVTWDATGPERVGLTLIPVGVPAPAAA